MHKIGRRIGGAFLGLLGLWSCDSAEPGDETGPATAAPSASSAASTGSGGNGGTGEAGGGGAGGDACAFELEGECGTCLEASCCDDATACQQDPDCWACVTGADPNACESNPETHERVNAFLVCRGGPCKEPCVGATGGPCTGLLDGKLAATCVDCLEANCCEEVAACHGNDGCWTSCLLDFNEQACHQNADGHALFHALGQCVSTSCTEPCQ